MRVLLSFLGLLPLVHGFAASPKPGLRLQPRASRREASVMAALPRREMLGGVALSVASCIAPRVAAAADGDAERDQWKRAVADIDKLETNYGTATRGRSVQPPPPRPPPSPPPKTLAANTHALPLHRVDIGQGRRRGSQVPRYGG
jgi:hypothetical protein